MKIERKDEKKEWILQFAKRYKGKMDWEVDPFTENFVNAYIDKFNIKIVGFCPYGIPDVPEIKQLLVELYKENKLGRYRVYTPHPDDGFPVWFYTYYPNNNIDGYREQWDIECCKCGKYILTEQRGTDNEIRCIRGSYDYGYYNGAEDQFYCKECAEKFGLE